MRKASFTLLEVFIALALVTLCAPLLFSTPFRIARKELNSFFLCELERLADKESYDFKIDLQEEGPFWQKIMKSSTLPHLLEQKNLNVSFAPGQKRTYVMKKEIVNIKSKPDGKLIQLKISLRSPTEKKEQSFTYLFVIQV
jgi:hypothetical protein